MRSAGELVQIRPMTAADLRRVMEIAESLKEAPHWAEAAWITAVDSATDPDMRPRRICLVAVDPLSGIVVGCALAVLLPPQAELESAGFREILLEVRASNEPAQGLYRGFGFSENGRRVRYYADPVEDAVLMRMRLG